LRHPDPKRPQPDYGGRVRAGRRGIADFSSGFVPRALADQCPTAESSPGEFGQLPDMHSLTISLQIFVAASVFFVWVVRYANIVEEFKQHGLPDWLRDSVGVLKLTFSLMLLIGIERGVFAVAGGISIALLMGAAFSLHLRVKNPVFKMLPSLALLAFSVVIAWINYRLLTP